jgi:hypothetical protein
MILDSAAKYVGRKKSVLMNEKGKISLLQHHRKALKEVFGGCATVRSVPRGGVAITSCATRAAGRYLAKDPWTIFRVLLCVCFFLYCLQLCLLQS